MLKDIKCRDDRIDLTFSHISQAEKKGRVFKEYMKSKVTQVTAKKRHDELAEELATVLEETLLELESLHRFLDAIEKLAVTSLHVFSDSEKVRLNLPRGVSLQDIRDVIAAARLICPRLLQFKRDAADFFLPKMQNVEVLAHQLDRYIQITKQICEVMQKRTHWDLEMTKKTWVQLDVNLTSEDVQRMIYHIGVLDGVRMDQHFRLVFLFHEKSCSTFLNEFSNRQPQMLKYLNELEEAAGKLNTMNKAAKISSVVGSSMGAVGGVLSIIGLALIPVTAGVSLGLTMTGIGLSITSGVNSAVTTATEIGVNKKHQKNANKVFEVFMENVQSLQNYLEEVSSQTAAVIKANLAEEAAEEGSVVTQAGNLTVLDSAVNAAPSAKVLQSGALFGNTGKVVVQEAKALRNVPRVASDIPDIGQAALKAPLAFSRSARAGLIGVNALFIGIDVIFLCQDSISLAKGSESKVSQFISARVALWRSEIKAWEKIQETLHKGLPVAEGHKTVLEMPFYPEMEIDEQQDIIM